MLNFIQTALAKISDVIGAIGDAIVDFVSAFGSVQEAVAGLGIQALTTIISLLINLLINLVCQTMDLVSVSVISLFDIDVGNGGSIFELIIGQIAPFTQVFQILGISLVIWFFLVGIIKSMTSPDGAGETPGRLISSTIIAGILVYMLPTIIRLGEQFFNRFFKMFVNLTDFQEFGFSDFALSSQTFIQDNDAITGAGAATESMLLCAFILFMMFIIVIRYFKFIIEILERYVLMGIILMTAPAAASFLVLKSTRQSFQAWVRLVLSQMFLMCTNIMFLGVFVKSMSSFSITLSALTAAGLPDGVSAAGAICVWTFMEATILEVAAKFDSYLNAVGFSTAETGGSTMLGMMATLWETGAIGAGLSNGHAAGTGSILSRITGTVGKSFSSAKEHVMPGKSVQDIIKKTNMGRVVPSSITAAVQTAKTNSVVQDADVGREILFGMKGVPSKIKQQLDPSSCRVSNGLISFSSQSMVPGSTSTTSVFMIPESSMKEYGSQMTGGRRVSFDGVSYRAFAVGAGATNFYTANPGFNKALEQHFGQSNLTHMVKENSLPTGIRTASVPTPISSMHPFGGRLEKQYIPKNLYTLPPDMAIHAVTENINGQEYYVVDMKLPYSEQIVTNDDGTSFRCKGRCLHPIDTTDINASQSSFQEQFAESINSRTGNYSNPVLLTGEQNSGILCYKTDDKVFAMAPQYENCLSNSGKETFVNVVEASNGASYTVVEIGHVKDFTSSDEMLMKAKSAFEQRQNTMHEDDDHTHDAIYGERIDFDQFFKSVSQQQAASGIFKTSAKKSKERS